MQYIIDKMQQYLIDVEPGMALYIYHHYIRITTNHIDTVRNVGSLLVEVFEEDPIGAEDFLTRIEEHDSDKLNEENIYFCAAAVYHYFTDNKVKVTKQCERLYDKWWKAHHDEYNTHHVLERYGVKKDGKYHVDGELDIPLAEMYADLTAMWIRLGGKDAHEYISQEMKVEFSDNCKDMLKKLKAVCDKYKADLLALKSNYEELDQFSSDEWANKSNSMEAVSMEAMSLNTTNKKIVDHILKIVDIIDPSKTNSARLSKMFANMSDKAFDKYMNAIKEGKDCIYIVAPNMKINLTSENLLKAIKALKLDIYQRIWFTDVTGRKYLSNEKYYIFKLPVRRQQQFLDEKISVSKGNTRDAMTGQVTGDSKAASITNPEVQLLVTKRLDKTISELITVRGGNIEAYNEMAQMLQETGSANLSDITTDAKTRSVVVGNTMLKAMMLDNNL